MVQRLNSDDHLQGAALLCQFLSNPDLPQMSSSIRKQAEALLALLSGCSHDLGAIFEFTGRRLLKQMMDPGSIGGIALGSFAGKGMQLLGTMGLMRLAPSLLTRGIVGRGIAALLGVAVEIPVMTLGGSALSGLFESRELELLKGFGREMKAGGIFVGSTRLAEAAIGGSFGLMAGVMLAHGIEVGAEDG